VGSSIRPLAKSTARQWQSPACLSIDANLRSTKAETTCSRFETARSVGSYSRGAGEVLIGKHAGRTSRDELPFKSLGLAVETWRPPIISIARLVSTRRVRGLSSSLRAAVGALYFPLQPQPPTPNLVMKYGLIAGNGRFPFLVLEGARDRGLRLLLQRSKKRRPPNSSRRHPESNGSASASLAA
jgi:hypothetical protein